MPLSRVEALSTEHRCDRFDCGKPPLNEWLQQYALASQRSDGPRTFIVHDALDVKGYYSLQSRQVEKSQGPERLGKGLGNYPIGVALLARLALDRSVQGIGLGKAMLKDAMLRVVRVSEDIGVRALIVDAIDDHAREFYERNGFVSFPDNPQRLMMLMKDLRASSPRRPASDNP